MHDKRKRWLTSSTKEKLKIWRALSDLFLDTEIDDVNFNYIARTILESELSLAEVEDILWYEVYPVLESNLRSIAGVWDGWTDAWLVEHLPPAVRPSAIGGKRAVIKEIERCWVRIGEIYEYPCLPQALLFFRQLLLRCSTSCIHAVVLRHKTVGTVLHDGVARRVKAMDGLNA